MNQGSETLHISDELYANTESKKCGKNLAPPQTVTLGCDSVEDVESSGQFFSSSSHSLVSETEIENVIDKKTGEDWEKEKSPVIDESLENFSSCDEYHEDAKIGMERSHSYENGSFLVRNSDDKLVNRESDDVTQTSPNQDKPEAAIPSPSTPLPRSHSYDDIETMGIVRYSREPTPDGSRPGSAMSSGTVYENVGPIYENMEVSASKQHLSLVDSADQNVTKFNVEKNSEVSPKIDYFRKLKQEKRQKKDRSLSIDETSTFALDHDGETSTCNELSHSFEAEEANSSPVVLEKSPPPVRRREKPVRHSSLLQNFFKRRKSSLELEGNVKHNSLPPGMQGVMVKMGESEVRDVSEVMLETPEDGLESHDSEKTSSPQDLASESLDEEFQSENLYENFGIGECSSVEVPVDHAVTPDLQGLTEPIINNKPLSFDTLKRRPLSPYSHSQSNQPYILPFSCQTTPVINITKKSGSIRSVYSTFRGATKMRRRTRKSSVSSISPDFDTLSRSGSRRELHGTSPSYLSLPRRKVIGPDTYNRDFTHHVSNDTSHENLPLSNSTYERGANNSQSESKDTSNKQVGSEAIKSDCGSTSNSPKEIDSFQNLKKTRKKTGRFSLKSLFRIGRRSSLVPSLKIQTKSPNKKSHMTLKKVPHKIVADMDSMDYAVASMAEMDCYE